MKSLPNRIGMAVGAALLGVAAKWALRAMSALPPLATELRTSLVVRFVPNSVIGTPFHGMRNW
jgi:hypothetical protein